MVQKRIRHPDFHGGYKAQAQGSGFVRTDNLTFRPYFYQTLSLVCHGAEQRSIPAHFIYEALSSRNPPFQRENHDRIAPAYLRSEQSL